MIPRGTNGRTIAVIVIACLLLLALVFATSGLSGSSTPPSQSTSIPTVAPIRGAVAAWVKHISGHVWEYHYIVQDTGTSPIGGFQINGQAANLYAIRESPHWPVFGSGICHGKYPGVLVYWSTGSGIGPIQPGKSARFSFKVATSGSRTLRYSLSFGAGPPFFGTTQGPAPSSLPAHGACR